METRLAVDDRVKVVVACYYSGQTGTVRKLTEDCCIVSIDGGERVVFPLFMVEKTRAISLTLRGK